MGCPIGLWGYEFLYNAAGPIYAGQEDVPVAEDYYIENFQFWQIAENQEMIWKAAFSGDHSNGCMLINVNTSQELLHILHRSALELMELESMSDPRLMIHLALTYIEQLNWAYVPFVEEFGLGTILCSPHYRHFVTSIEGVMVLKGYPAYFVQNN